MSSELMATSENDPIREYQAVIEKAKERGERLRPIVKACQEAIVRSGAKAAISIGKRTPAAPKVEITMCCDSLDETIPLFRELRKEGLRTDKNDSHRDIKALDVIPMREYKLGPDVMLTAIVMEKSEVPGGPRCRMEQVGVQQVPVYEMKCD